jgi:hypothetical protein
MLIASSAARPIGPLELHLRCIETRHCFPCTSARTTSSATAANGAASNSSTPVKSNVSVAAATAVHSSILSDPLLPYVLPAIAPQLRARGFDHVDVTSSQRAFSTDVAVPLPFTLPSYSGLPPLDVDPRHLFARCSPANIIGARLCRICPFCCHFDLLFLQHC